jgi:acetyl-CoA acetyltransferase
VDTVSPARAAERFHAAVSARQDGAACAMLAPKTADRLPDPGQTCAQALAELGLGPAGPVTAVAVWGADAQVRLAGDTVFLHHFGDGWRIRAASCKPVRDLPYDCDVDD